MRRPPRPTRRPAGIAPAERSDAGDRSRVHAGGAAGDPPARRRGAPGRAGARRGHPRRPGLSRPGGGDSARGHRARLGREVRIGRAGAHGDRRVSPGARLAAPGVRGERARAEARRGHAARPGARDGSADGGGQRGRQGMGSDLSGPGPARRRPAERRRAGRRAGRGDQRRLRLRRPRLLGRAARHPGRPACSGSRCSWEAPRRPRSVPEAEAAGAVVVDSLPDLRALLDRLAAEDAK